MVDAVKTHGCPAGSTGSDWLSPAALVSLPAVVASGAEPLGLGSDVTGSEVASCCDVASVGSAVVEGLVAEVEVVVSPV